LDLLLHRSFASLACAGCCGCGLTLVITNSPDLILARRPAELAHRNELLDTEAKNGVQRQPVPDVKSSVACCKQDLPLFTNIRGVSWRMPIAEHTAASHPTISITV